jgi:mono/diheme cytochrome c family protein
MATFLSNLHRKYENEVKSPQRGRVGILHILLLISAAIVLVQSASLPATAQAGKAPAGNRENGKKLYNDNACYACHGMSAEGGAGPRLGPEAIPFPDFLERVRRPTDVMPPFDEKMISDAEVADIYAFVKTVEAAIVGESQDGREVSLRWNRGRDASVLQPSSAASHLYAIVQPR